jgi:DNA-directed RNA polymerase subunit M/transcription elongation factor TFIIS
MGTKFCPKCGSGALVHDASYGGIMRCKECGYRSALFPEKFKEKMKKARKKTNKKGQMKIQEMAFVLVAVMFLGALLFLFFAQFQQRMMTEQATTIKEERVSAMLGAIAGMPEFGCSGLDVLVCADEAKLSAFAKLSKESKDNYAQIWQSASVSKIVIQEVYPNPAVSYQLYSDAPKSHKSTKTQSTFIPLCHSSYTGAECSIARIKVTVILPET